MMVGNGAKIGSRDYNGETPMSSFKSERIAEWFLHTVLGVRKWDDSLEELIATSSVTEKSLEDLMDLTGIPHDEQDNGSTFFCFITCVICLKRIFLCVSGSYCSFTKH